MKKLQLLIAIGVAVLLITGGLVYFLGFYHQGPSEANVVASAMNYINNNIPAGNTAQLVDSSSAGSVYEIHIKIGSNEYYSYITKDGKMLFPTGIDLSSYAASSTAATGAQTQQQATSTSQTGPVPSDLASFAQCVSNSGAKFYGAFWCPHCQDQKTMFGSAASDLPYIECSTQDEKGELQVCQDANITSYPTWVFANGTRQSGELSFQTLSQETGCPLQ